MKTKGIRISDEIEGVISVKLPDILVEIHNGSTIYWSILYLDASGNLGEEISIVDFENQIFKSENGLYIGWDELNKLSHKFYEIIDIVLIGCKNKNLLYRYKEDREMYETCDIVIQLIDSGYWEIFSKDGQLINSLASKFKEIKHIESDFIP